MRDKLPPLHLLATLEAVVRNDGFAKAAAELFITPSAISGQMRQLEDYLGQRLFLRRAQGIEVLPEARAYSECIREALSDLRAGHSAFQRATSNRERLVISALPALAHCWLVPRFAEFRRSHPGVDVSLVAEDEIVDFAQRPQVDVGLRYTNGQHPDAEVHPLFHDWLVPVCAPDVAERLRASGAQANAKDLSLLVNSRWESDWALWTNATGQPIGPLGGELYFSHYSMMMQAAENGLGVAIAHVTLSSDSLRRGSLVTLVDRSVRAPMNFYMAIGAQARDKACVNEFRQWMLKTLERERLDSFAVPAAERTGP